jgi:hypothetical protein
MQRDCRELSMAQLLSDCITRAVMNADGVDPGELEAMLRRVAASRARRPAVKLIGA